MLELPDFSKVEEALRKLSSPKWLEKVGRAGIDILTDDMIARLVAIESQTPFARSTLANPRGRVNKPVQGQNFGRDTGQFHDSWLNSLSFKNGEFSFTSDLNYAIEQQEIAAVKSPYPDGYLGISDGAFDRLEEAIALEAEKTFYA